MRWLGLYGSLAKDFPSAFNLEESVERLAAASETPNYRSTTDTAIGKVSVSRVRLHRYNPRVGNGLKPLFVGRFVRERGRVVLRGRFTVSPFGKSFMTIWFAFLLFMTFFGVKHVLTADPRAWPLPLTGAGLLAFGAVMVWWCNRLGRDDVAWLSELITRSLSGGHT